jgi:hypothetical protein
LNPCATGPSTSAATIVPSTVPEFEAGQAGLPPPPQKNTETPPLTPRCPTWMCAADGGPVRSAYTSLNVIWVFVIVAVKSA